MSSADPQPPATEPDRRRGRRRAVRGLGRGAVRQRWWVPRDPLVGVRVAVADLLHLAERGGRDRVGALL